MTLFIVQKRYSLLVSLCLLHVAVQATNGIWADDFWEHAADVREFMTHPFRARHPLFLADSPHSYLNPYSYIVALIAKGLRLDAINALALFSVVNFTLLTIGIRLFVATLAERQTNTVAFYGLVFMMILWGPNPWLYSSFFSYAALGSVLPLPSAFALGLSLICLSLHSNQAFRVTVWGMVSAIGLITLVLLSHPLTMVFLLPGLFCQAICPATSVKQLSGFAAMVAFSVLLANCWPYFSIVDLFLGGGDAYHESNANLYVDIFIRISPVLMLLPLAYRDLVALKNRPVLLLICCLLVIYVYGGYTKKYSFGRAISFLMILLQLFIASAIARMETNIGKHKIGMAIQLLSTTGLIILTVGSTIGPDIRRTATVLNAMRQHSKVGAEITYKNYTFLKNLVEPYDLVLANLDVGYISASFGGKLIAIRPTVAFLSDIDRRRTDVLEFFSCLANDEIRIAILDRYHPKYLLLDKAHDRCVVDIFRNNSRLAPLLVQENEQLALYRLDVDDLRARIKAF